MPLSDEAKAAARKQVQCPDDLSLDTMPCIDLSPTSHQPSLFYMYLKVCKEMVQRITALATSIRAACMRTHIETPRVLRSCMHRVRQLVCVGICV